MRPTDYKEEYNDLAFNYCLLGATDKELGDFFEVCERTINNWKDEYPEFLQSIKKGKEIADGKVASRLYQRAVGVTVKETRLSGGGDDDEAPAAIETTKELPPDTTAAIFWLKNRQPKKWRDKQEVEHSGTVVTKNLRGVKR